MSDDSENETIAAALRDANDKVRGAPAAFDSAPPATEERRTSFDGGARPSSPPAESPEEAHQRFIGDLLGGSRGR